MTRDIVDQLLDAVNGHDLQAVLRCYRTDAAAVSPELEMGNPDEIGAYYTQIWDGFPDLHFEVLEKATAGDVICAVMLASGTHTGPYLAFTGDVLPPTGRKVAAAAGGISPTASSSATATITSSWRSTPSSVSGSPWTSRTLASAVST